MAIHMVMREEEATGSFVVGGFFFSSNFSLFLNSMASECSATFLPARKSFIKAEGKTMSHLFITLLSQ